VLGVKGLSQILKKNLVGRLGGSVGQAAAPGSGHDPRVLGSSPASGSLLSGEPSGEPASPSACRSPCCALSPSDK